MVLNPARRVFPGMTAYVSIPVATATNVLKVPNSALRYTPPLPPEQLRAAYAKHGIDVDAPARPRSFAVVGITTDAAPEAATVWKRNADKTLEPVQFTPGITDHAFTEVRAMLKGTLSPGDDVVTGSLAASAGAGGPGAPTTRR